MLLSQSLSPSLAPENVSLFIILPLISLHLPLISHLSLSLFISSLCDLPLPLPQSHLSLALSLSLCLSRPFISLSLYLTLPLIFLSVPLFLVLFLDQWFGPLFFWLMLPSQDAPFWPSRLTE